ncbi:Hypothetical predicted protein [Mytilus galloprovincialis]|uniref:Uncharacterized protein n=1 Tax=Mytilus galloprovincialis TaxID=29158 RepID=A0A8B6FN95_MYTGA|nr:Hypothetical predicted protein [Mytilus galloprovincialis]
MSYSQLTSTIAQLLMYSCTTKQSNRHMKDHEPPVCAYLGVMIHCKTRKRDLVDTFFKLGLSVSYDRMLEISTSMANDACRRYVQEGIVCPANLFQNGFTSSAVDNIDHNPSSISSKDSFYGTGISFFQHISEDAQGVVQAFDQSETMLKCQSKRVSLLPESYSNLPPAVLRFNETDIPLVEGELSIDMFSFPAALKGEFKWLKHVAENLTVRATVGTNISWSAYHAAVLPDGNKLPAVSLKDHSLVFALNHTNYSRWLLIHLRDMVQLLKKNPETHRAFLDGNFVVNKTEKKFSCMAIDQTHEQNNACVKADGGAVGLTENPGALRRLMVAGPEMARLVNEFENVTECFVNTNASNKLHHEQILSFQESFRNYIVSLYGVIYDLGNPFLETSKDLLGLDS